MPCVMSRKLLPLGHQSLAYTLHRRAVSRTRKILIALGAVLALAILLRATGPWVVEQYVNRELSDMGEYRGTVSDVDLALIRGGYKLYDVNIVKVDAATETPFIAMEQMDLSLQWEALLRGGAVGEVVMHGPVVNLVQSKSEEESQLGTGVNWPAEVRELFPFQLNVVQVVDGLVTFRAPGIEAAESLTARDFQMTLLNLTNVQDRETEAFADIDLDARIMGNAPFALTGQIDPNEEVPTFDINLSLEGARLVDVNPWIVEFLKADAHAGVFSLYSELAAADGRFQGYLRPFLENPEFFHPEEAASGPFKKAWEALVSFAAKIFENRTTDQVATQIPLSGTFEEPKAGLLPALVNLLRNAFVAGFAHSLQGTIDLGDVEDQAACVRGEVTGEPPDGQDGRRERRRARDEEQRRGDEDSDDGAGSPAEGPLERAREQRVPRCD